MSQGKVSVPNKTVSWWKYNPILQKPRSLDPVRPWSWFWYYGPDPAAGVSYGQFHDTENKFDIVTEKPEAPNVVYSPANGEPMDFVTDVSYGELQELLSKTTSHSINHQATCGSCTMDLMSDFDLGIPDNVFCPKCGGGVEVQSSDDSKQIKEKTMASKKSADRAKRVESLKTRIRANIIKKRKVEAAKLDVKPKKSKLTPKQLKQRALARKKKALAADDNEMISLDTIMEAMDQEIEEEEAECGEEENPEEAEMYMEEEGEEEEVEASEGGEEIEEEVEDEAEWAGTPMEESLEGFEEEEEDEGAAEMGEVIEDAIEDAVEDAVDGDEESDEDDYMDLDMVISMIKKKEKLNKAKKRAKLKALADKKARLKAKIKSKRKVKAEEEGEEEIEEAEMEEEGEEEEAAEMGDAGDGAGEAGGAGEDPDHGDPNDTPNDVPEEVAETGDTSPEPDMVSEENPDADEESESTEAMRFEPLASVAKLQDVKKEEIDLSLYGEETENPTWNVTVAGIPTARIQLKNQQYPEQIRATFCSEDYAKNIMIHCEKTGFSKTMANVKAEFWANHTSNSKIAARFKSEAKKEFGAERKKLVASFRDDYRSCINIVSAGLSKNFYPELGNSLKDSLFTNLKTVGLPENTAVSAIEKAFAESSSDYFNALFNKAEEYLDKHPEALSEISAAIANGSTLNHYSDENLADAAPATLSDRVAQASVLPAANQGYSTAGLKVAKDLVLDTENYKAQLKNVMKNR